jgi:hypothetical protein
MTTTQPTFRGPLRTINFWALVIQILKALQNGLLRSRLAVYFQLVVSQTLQPLPSSRRCQKRRAILRDRGAPLHPLMMISHRRGIAGH